MIEIFIWFYLMVATGVFWKSEKMEFGSKWENKVAPWALAIIWPLLMGYKIASYGEDEEKGGE